MNRFQSLFSAVDSFFLIDIALKSFLLLLATLIATRLLRKQSAAIRHGLWTTGFAASLAVPVVALALPAWNLPILPRMLLASLTIPTDVNARPTVSDAAHAQRLADSDKSAPRQAFAAELSALHEQRDLSNGQHAGDRVGSPHSAPTTAARVRQLPRAEAAATANFSWSAACLVIWLLGTAICLSRIWWDAVVLKRTFRLCRDVSDLQWQRALAEASRTLSFTRRVRLKGHEEAQTPMVAGILQTVVLLPNDAAEWTPSQRRFVLLHELAHAKRHDILTQAMAAMACACYWFNPIGWWGLAQMRKLRELACDDMVIATGQQPADYAAVLLNVAKSYRYRRVAAAVGMARGTNVENRIMLVLDKARSRVAISAKGFALLATLAAAVVLVIGSMRLESRAQESPAPPASAAGAPAKKTEKPKKEQQAAHEPRAKGPDTEARTIEVCITDEQGEPLAGAKLHVSSWEFDGDPDYPNRDYTTNAEGVAVVARARRVQILRMWPYKPGYVGQFVNFAEGTHSDGKRIPDRYDFRLARGTTLSGTVVDERGQPIPGVKVDVQVYVDEPAWGTNPKPMISTWLTDDDYQDYCPITSKDGKWSIRNAPAPAGGKDFGFGLKFTHKDYISDSQWGELQTEQGITTAALRDGSARVVLRPGVALAGTVTDTAGKPVSKGLVIWSDDPYFGQGVNEAQLDNAGRFKTLTLPPGERSITVVAPGFRPERRKMNLASGMDELKFTLQPGKRLTLKVVDPAGKPVPRASIGIGKWRGAESIYNHKHPNVPESHIPREAGENGVYTWDWAPDDAVAYQVWAEGFASKEVTLVATEAAHVVEMVRPLVASGKVTDASSGQPVQDFSVTPVSVHRPKFLSTSFDDTVSGADGRYEIELATSADDNNRYQVRLEADGYRSAIGERSFVLEDGRVTQDFALEPAAAREGIVVDSSGNPVTGATIVEATPSILPAFSNGKLNWGSRQTETTDGGKFQLRATYEPSRIRVFHDAGFAEIAREAKQPIGTIKLAPWARIPGRLLQDGKPVANQTIYFSLVMDGQLGEPRFQDTYQQQTDIEGRFAFDRLPPIAGSVRAALGPWRDSPLSSSQAVPLDLKPGDNKTITLGGEGATVTGKVVATGRDNAKLDKNWSLNYFISRDRGIELPAGFSRLGFDPRQPVKASWFLDPNSNRWLTTREHYSVKLSPDGQLRISGVTPGTYDLVLRLYEQPAGCLVETVGEKVVTVEIVGADVASGVKDIGTIDVECRSGPRVGEYMGLYKFTDATGREHSIKDMKGRYVLMHVWASWCADCLESMPDIQATVARLGTKPITFVGLNVDADASLAKRISSNSGLKWSQSYLGDSSDMARQLAISSVPTYFLVGPDGLLVASTTEWPEMKETLEAAIAKTKN